MSAVTSKSRPVRYTRLLIAMIFVISMMSFSGIASAKWVPDTIERIETSSGELMDDDSEFARVSDNGRYVVFHTQAENLIPNDNKSEWDNDVYCYDRETGDLELISVATDGTMGNGCSTKPSISADGRYVTFQSGSDNLVADDDNDAGDIFLRDRVAGTTILISEHSDTCSCGSDVECAVWPQISANGTRITYRTKASDIVPDDTNEAHDIFVYDIASKETTRANVTSDGEQGYGGSHWPTLSADGRYVAFRSHGHLTDDPLAPCDDEADEKSASVASDTETFCDGDCGDESATLAEDLHDDGTHSPQVYVRDLELGTTKLVSISTSGTTGDQAARWPSLSADGRYVAFQSGASNLVAGDTNQAADIFVRDMVAGTTTRVSVASDGTEAGGEGYYWEYCSSNPDISSDGRFVTFQSGADNLVPDDTNEEDDIFVHDMLTGETTRASVSYDGVESDDGSEKPAISADGSVVVFGSDASNLIDGESINYVETKALQEESGAEHDHIYITTNVGDYNADETAGTSRFTTSAETSKKTFPDGAEDVIVATGRNWPDALGGAALAGALNGPVLLVDTDAIPAAIAGEIKRLGADRALILGGEDAVSGNVEAALQAMNISVERIGGATRYETADMIAARTVDILGPDYDGTAFVATGNNFADALSASPLACAGGWPVYLSGTSGVSDSTLAAMLAAGVTDAVLLGGDAAVTPETSVSILGAGMTATRIAGDSRYDTATKIAEYGVDTLGLRWNHMALTTGLDFPDALSGGVMQGRNGSVMLLTKPTSLAGDTRACLDENSEAIGTVNYLGGLNAVSQAVRDAVAEIIE